MTLDPATRADSRALWARAFPLILSDRQYQRWRRLQILSGALPVAVFLVFHFLTNGAALAGPDAFNGLAARLDRLPWIRPLEILGVALPIALHVVLGLLLGDTAQGAGDARLYPRPWMMAAQRATGGFLVVYAIFHVWGIRLAPAPESGPRDLFTITRTQLEHPGMFVFYALAVIAASLHLGLGMLAASDEDGARARRRTPAPVWIATVLMAAIGLNALLAFVSRPARWLEGPRSAATAHANPAGSR